MNASIDIGPATLERMRPDLVIARFKPGSIAGADSFEMSMNARREHFSDTPHAVIVMAPDDVEFNLSIVDKDHYKDQGVDAFTTALAVVSTNTSFTRVLELYYAMHPAPFPVKIFALQQDAFAWVEEQLAARKGA